MSSVPNAEIILNWLYKKIALKLQQGASILPELPWLDLQTIDAVAIPLAEAEQQNVLELILRNEVSTSDFPMQVLIRDTIINLRTRISMRPRIQSATIQNISHDGGLGTVAGLVRDSLHHERYYILSCGHVLAGELGARVGDEICITINSNDKIKAQLVDWEPVLGATIPATGIDAAIASVEAESIRKYIEIPKGISNSFTSNQNVIVKTLGGFKSGILKTRWSGYVDVETTGRVGDYFLQDAIAYIASPETVAGDSGSAIWNQQDQLIGIHVAAPTGSEQWHTNAVLCPIDRIMEWFDIEPITSESEGTRYLSKGLTISRNIETSAAMSPNNFSSDEREIIAKTLWGEARGEGEQGMRLVANVIANRRRKYNKPSYAAVCLAKWQFSCWNDNDHNRRLLNSSQTLSDSMYWCALQIADKLLANMLPDDTRGATHYFATTLKKRPSWALGKDACYTHGNHLFFKDID